MKIKTHKIEEFNNEIIIRDVRVNRKEYQLLIINENGDLDFNFCKNMTPDVSREIEPEFTISIFKGKICFGRHYYRKHDHDDFETLQTVINENALSSYLDRKINDLIWRDDFPEEKEGFAQFQIPFGSNTDFKKEYLYYY